MPFYFTCPYCFKKTLVDEALAGSKGPCVSCGKLITVPEPPRKQPEASRPLGSTYVGPDQLKKRAEYKLWLVRAGSLILGVVAVSMVAIYGFWPTVKGLKARRDAIACMNNLQRIAKALNSYAAEHGTYPTPTVVDSTGKPLYSWRVLILPYLDEAGLHASFNLSEPWDSESNSQLIPRCPEVFISPGVGGIRGLSETSYVLLTGTGSIFPTSGPLSPPQVSDGLSKTLLVVETKNSVHEWSKPFDIDIAQLNSRIGATGPNSIGGNHAEGATAAFADGNAAWLPADLPPTILDAVISPNGNEAIPIDPAAFKFR